MNFRYTIKELESWTDYEFLRRIITERKSTCTNIYSPLYQRLVNLESKINYKQDLTK